MKRIGDRMSMSETYECGACGKRMQADKAPRCCGKPMKPLKLDACTGAFGAEHSRPMQDDEPCDDSRG